VSDEHCRAIILVPRSKLGNGMEEEKWSSSEGNTLKHRTLTYIDIALDGET